jgi:1,4-alpha-glucan branching enzyme
MPGDVWRKFANLRALFGLMFGFPGKKLLFMGGEFGQWHEWSHERSLDWDLLKHEHHRGLHLWVHDLNNLYSTETALAEEDFSHHGFEWVDFHDAANSIISFERRSTGGQEQLLVVCNFTPVPRLNYRIGTRLEGVHRELLNSDATAYGGSNLGNYGEIHTEPVPRHNRPFSLSLTLPPLSVLYIKHSDRI